MCGTRCRSTTSCLADLEASCRAQAYYSGWRASSRHASAGETLNPKSLYHSDTWELSPARAVHLQAEVWPVSTIIRRHLTRRCRM